MFIRYCLLGAVLNFTVMDILVHNTILVRFMSRFSNQETYDRFLRKVYVDAQT